MGISPWGFESLYSYMSQRKYNKEELEEAVKNSLSIAEVLRHLNIIPAGGNYKKVAEKFGSFK